MLANIDSTENTAQSISGGSYNNINVDIGSSKDHWIFLAVGTKQTVTITGNTKSESFRYSLY